MIVSVTGRVVKSRAKTCPGERAIPYSTPEMNDLRGVPKMSER